MINQRYLIRNISLKFYGGFGNNLQQIALAIMFSEKYNKNLIVDNHQFIDKVSYKNSKIHLIGLYQIILIVFFTMVVNNLKTI